MKITLGKCWQSDHGSLIFQCSTRDGLTRRKGFLELSPTNPEGPVVFTDEKPALTLTAGGIATLIRKHLTAGSLTSIALSEPTSSNQQSSHGAKHEFLRLSCHGKTSSGQDSAIYLVLSTKPDREITVIVDKTSIARFREKARYTVPKKAILEHVEAEDLEVTGFNAWAHHTFSMDQKKSKEPTLGNSPCDNQNSPIPPYQRAARDRVSRRLKTLRKTLAQDLGKIPAAAMLLNARKDAELLRNFIWLVKPEAFALDLDSTQTGEEPRTIKLDSELSAGANLEAAFVKIKKLERSISVGRPRVGALTSDIGHFEAVLEQLRNSVTKLSELDVLNILRELRLERKPAEETAKETAKKTAKNTQPHAVKHLKASVGRCFQVSAGSYIVVGRNAEESDKVVKASKSQDWWLHVAGGGHGSHVIVAGTRFKDGLPAALLRAAGVLALHFSDRSNSREGEVYVARRHQIKKRKGAAAGLWQVDRAESVLIRYESAEVAVLFSKEIRYGVQRPTTAPVK